MKLDGTVYLWIFIFCGLATVLWLAAWYSRKPYLRWLCRRRLDEGYPRAKVGSLLTRAREQRLIDHQEELLLREELKLEETL